MATGRACEEDAGRLAEAVVGGEPSQDENRDLGLTSTCGPPELDGSDAVSAEEDETDLWLAVSGERGGVSGLTGESESMLPSPRPRPDFLRLPSEGGLLSVLTDPARDLAGESESACSDPADEGGVSSSWWASSSSSSTTIWIRGDRRRNPKGSGEPAWSRDGPGTGAPCVDGTGWGRCLDFDDWDDDPPDGGLMAADEGAANLRAMCSENGRPSLCDGVGGST